MTLESLLFDQQDLEAVDELIEVIDKLIDRLVGL